MKLGLLSSLFHYHKKNISSLQGYQEEAGHPVQLRLADPQIIIALELKKCLLLNVAGIFMIICYAALFQEQVPNGVASAYRKYGKP